MNESLKAVFGAIVILGLMGCITWIPGHPESWTLTVRWIALGMVVVPLPVLIWASRRKDKAPDFLWQHGVRPFERDGFCFLIIPEMRNGRSGITVIYQNQFAGRCEASLVINTSWSLLKRQPKIKGVTLGIKSAPGGYGTATFSVPFPPDSKGRKVSLDVAASVNYPDGRGALLRFKNGLRVGATNGSFWQEGVQVLGMAAGSLIITRPARFQMVVPFNGDGESTEIELVDSQTLWQCGDHVGVVSGSAPSATPANGHIEYQHRGA